MLVSTYLAAAPVIDIDGTFFLQAGIFLGLMVVLQPLLFKPWLQAHARREESISGSLARAKTLRTEADELGRRYDERLDAARDQALTLRSQLRREEEIAQARRLAETREQAGSELDETRRRIAQESDTARTALGSRVDDLADQIANKLLGRTA